MSDDLHYHIIGDDTQSPTEKLEKYTGVVTWDYLKPHFKSGSLIFVDQSLNLTEVGYAFTEDNKEQIQAWLKSGDLLKPSEPHAQWWEANPQEFTALVVSPFVLMQPLKG